MARGPLCAHPCSTDFLSGSNIRIKYKSNNLIQCILVNCVAQSAAANISKASAVLLLQNVPTAVAVTRRMRICPRYQRETEILKLKTVANLSYADACKEVRTSRNPSAPHLASQSTYPPTFCFLRDGTLILRDSTRLTFVFGCRADRTCVFLL